MIEFLPDDDLLRRSIAQEQQIMSHGPQKLHEIPGYGQGTIAQLSMYCWLQRMDIDNAYAVMLANSVSAKSRLVKAMAAVMAQLNSENFNEFGPADVGDYACPRAGGPCTVHDFLRLECGLKDTDFSKGLDNYVGRQAVIDLLQTKVRKELNEVEYRQADPQVALNRAETCSATCSNLIRQFAKPTQNSAMQI